jgi:hypothetical protein
MASTLNKFVTIATPVTTVPTIIYTAPALTTSIILLAQVANADTGSSADITFSSSAGGGTELVKNFTVPTGDAASVLTGKLVLEPAQSVSIFASANAILKVTLSVLETK